MANTRRWTIALGLVCAALAYGDNSVADSLTSTYGDELVETGHRVAAKLDGRVAVVTVTRTVDNKGEHADEARFKIDLPFEGAVVGLRVKSRGKWVKGAIADSAAAQNEYERLTTSGSVNKDGPALMSWIDTANVELALFPIKKGTARTVRYTIRAGTCYREGLRVFGYPSAGSPKPSVDASKGRVYETLDKAPLRVRDAVKACNGDTGVSIDSHTWVVFDAPVRGELSAAYASFETGADQRIARLEIDASRELSAKPKRAKVVFVLDASHTQGAAGIAAQLELAKMYLDHVPDASFEVVLYRRYAERLLGRFAPARDADAALAAVRAAAFDPNNGSNLDEGLGLAATLLSGTEGAARVVAFTDSRLRVGFENSGAVVAFSSAPEQTVLHIVDSPLSSVADVKFGRFDGHDLAGVAGEYGGIVISETGDDTWEDVEMSMLALVRPLQIDSLNIGGLEVGHSGSLFEGGAIRHMEVLPAANAPSSIEITGQVWARKLSRTVTIDSALTAELPAIVFGTAHWRDLAPESIETVARAGKAVSPKTSYLAVNPKLGPSSTDFAGGLGISGVGISSRCGGSRCGIRGIGHIGTSAAVADLNAILAGWLQPAAESCQAMHATPTHETKLNLELHSQEVADVTVDTNASNDFAACVADAAWEIQLDTRFYRDFDRRIVSLAP